ncbi:MAG TPA: hypothetical protein VGA71_03650, partial [Actinomycetota bacterium]
MLPGKFGGFSLAGNEFSPNFLGRWDAIPSPVRDALRRLAQEGFLEDTEGWTGYRVRRPDLPRIEELYEVRLSLEQTAVRRLAAAPADPE